MGAGKKIKKMFEGERDPAEMSTWIFSLTPLGVAFAFFLIFSGAAVLASVALYTRQPLIIAYVALGALIGPYGFSLVTDLLNAVGFAYLQTGDHAAAASILSVETNRQAHYKPWSSPIVLAPMALNAALQGDDDLAYRRLSQAVDKGWADYYRAINDPRWGDVLSQPRFVTLLEKVQADLAEQRAQVEALLEATD